jgi:hypothetical protein
VVDGTEDIVTHYPTPSFKRGVFKRGWVLAVRQRNFRVPDYKMDGFTVTELVTRAIKYFLEGLAVALATFIIPQKKLNVEEILAVSIVAAVTFALLDLLAPSIGLTARQGAGFGLGANLVGFPKL